MKASSFNQNLRDHVFVKKTLKENPLVSFDEIPVN